MWYLTEPHSQSGQYRFDKVDQRLAQLFAVWAVPERRGGCKRSSSKIHFEILPMDLDDINLPYVKLTHPFRVPMIRRILQEFPVGFCPTVIHEAGNDSRCPSDGLEILLKSD